MILDLLPILSPLRVVLASASPRRLELLGKLGLSVVVRPSQFSETLSKAGVSASDYVRATARGKALDVRDALDRECAPFDVIVSSDTVIELDGEILEKPCDVQDARRMLTALSGRRHNVLTAVCIIVNTGSLVSPLLLGTPATTTMEPTHRGEPASDTTGGALISFVETAEVSFAALPLSLIEAYISTPEPFDKAGGYGIQGMAAQFISGIHGDYYCVMGFPVHAFCLVLRALVEQGLIKAKDS